MRRNFILTLLTSFATLSASALAAQTVHGTLADAATGVGVRGATVVLVDAQGRSAVAAVTGARGAFVLRATAAGRYSLRAERVGFVATLSPAFALAAGETVERTLAADPRRVMLEAISVTSRARCRVRPGAGEAAAAVWEEARKALNGARTAADQRLLRYGLRRYRRVLDPKTLTVTAEETRTIEGWSGNPFVAADPARLAEKGFMVADGDSLLYFAPDAGVLLSDAFLDTHCFRVQTAASEHPGWIGLAFEPVRDGGRADVAGVLWVDRASAELRSIDYRYTSLPAGRRAEEVAGGAIELRRLPAGSWIVSRWHIRMPRMSVSALRPDPSLPLNPRPITVAALVEEGGEIAEVADESGRTLASERGATLSGTVYDSTASKPLAGARVSLDGTPYAAAADSGGAFVLAGVPDGAYTLSFWSARLDSMGFVPRPVPVTLARTAAARVELAVPPLASVLAAACGDRAGAGGGAPLVGIVREEGADGAPAPGTVVTAAWTAAPGAGGVPRTAVADDRGAYRFCSVPAGVALRVAAGSLAGAANGVQVRLSAGVPMRQDLTVRRPSAAPAGRASAAAARERAGSGTIVWGRVVAAATGAAVVGARVQLGESLPAQATDRMGRFRVDGVPAGAYEVVVTHAEFGRRVTRAVVAGTGMELVLRLPAPSGTVALAPVVVSARTLSPVQVQARTSGTRMDVIDGETIARAVGEPDVQNLLRVHVNGIVTSEVRMPGTDFVTRIDIYYHHQSVAVYLDSRRVPPADLVHLPPDLLDSAEFFPSGTAAYGAAGGPVLLLHSKQRSAAR
ncbi:MAG: hypothetical protein JWM27_3063 [Gemmatimonadetes bacterium]|nr:hypothetical protein [Gemmatimonadota bacterium]